MTSTSLVSGSEDWLRHRHTAVTGTDVGKVLGLDPYCTRKHLMECKVREIDQLKNANAITKRIVSMGNTFEEAAREAFVTGDPIMRSQGFKPSLHHSKRYEYLCGTPDYLIPSGTGGTVVEIKTHFYPNMEMAEPLKEVPPKHYLQVQAYLEIMEWEEGLLWSWTMNRGHALWRITRDQETWQQWVEPHLRVFHETLKALRREEKTGDPESVTLTLRRYRMNVHEKTKNLEAVSRSMEKHVTKLE
jgi:putative phage-type endonuclease